MSEEYFCFKITIKANKSKGVDTLSLIPLKREVRLKIKKNFPHIMSIGL